MTNATTCKNGHAYRRNSAGKCMDCAIDRVRRHREKNYDAIKTRRAELRIQNIEKERAKGREKYAKRKTAAIEYSRKYREENREKVLECLRKYWKENSDVLKEAKRKHAKENPEAYAAKAAKRRAAILRAIPSWFGEFDDLVHQEAYDLAARRRQCTGTDWHVDHIVPIQGRNVCGLHCWQNLQVIPARSNLQKGNRWAA